MVSRMVSSSSSRASDTMSVRWTITSLAVMLSNSKTFSMSSFSLLWMAPDSSPSSTMAMMLSSDTDLFRFSSRITGRYSSARLPARLTKNNMGHIWYPDTEIPPCM